MRTVKMGWRWWQQALFPLKCVVCRREGAVLCAEHALLPAPILPPLDTFRPLDDLHAVTDYHQVAGRALVRWLKFHRHQAPITVMAEYLQEVIPWQRWPQAVLVPLPLHWWREHQRGFNQSARLALAVGQFLDKPVDDTSFKRLKPTRQQAKLSKSERQKNLQGAFAWTATTPPPHTLVLLDDVCTTGSTLKEAARTLKRAGVKRVVGVVFAYQSLN